MTAHQLAGGGDVEAGTNADRGRHLVARQRLAAEFQDLVLDRDLLSLARRAAAFSTTSATTMAPVIGFARPHQRHAHAADAG